MLVTTITAKATTVEYPDGLLVIGRRNAQDLLVAAFLVPVTAVGQSQDKAIIQICQAAGNTTGACSGTDGSDARERERVAEQRRADEEQAAEQQRQSEAQRQADADREAYEKEHAAYERQQAAYEHERADEQRRADEERAANEQRVADDARQQEEERAARSQASYQQMMAGHRQAAEERTFNGELDKAKADEAQAIPPTPGSTADLISQYEAREPKRKADSAAAAKGKP